MYKKNKKGFTLAEVLITIAVIAVVAAILLPLANRFRPDAIKIKYLKTYDAITEVVSKLARNQELFNGLYEDPATNTIYKIQKSPFLMHSNTFAEEFVDALNPVEGGVRAGGNNVLGQAEFSTKDGTAWTVESRSNINLLAGTGTFLSETQVWLDGNRNNNAENNHFQFYITADGQTYIADEQGLRYKETRSSFGNGGNQPVIPELPDINEICVNDFREENVEHYPTVSGPQSTGTPRPGMDDLSSAESSSSETTNEESASSASSSSGTTNEESASSAPSSSGTTNEESASSTDYSDEDYQSSEPDQSDGYWDYDPGDDWW